MSDVRGDSPSSSQHDTSSTGRAVGRRGLLLGGAAAAASVAAFAAGSPSAGARGSDTGSAGGRVRPHATTDGPTVASPAVSGVVYRHASMFDFSVEDGSQIRYWGGYGVYAAGSTLHATIEIPTNARIHDIEWYVYNGTAAAVTGSARLWSAGSGFLSASAAEATIATYAGIAATRIVAGAANNGPYPIGTKLDLLVNAQGTSLQVNGARVGFDVGAGQTGLLAAPVRAYDSRTQGGLFHAGETRIIALPTGAVAPGSAGALVNITAVGGAGNGYLKVYSAAAATPSASALNFPANGAAIANALTVAVSKDSKIKVTASGAVHVIVDVTGVIA